MKKYYKKFTSKRDMVETLANLSDVFDTKAMLDFIPKSGPRRLYIFTTEGERVVCDNFKKFINIMSYKGNLDLMYPLCFGRGQVYHVFSKVDHFSEAPTDTSESIKDEVDTIVPEDVEVLSEGLTEVSVDVVEVSEEPELEVDWEWVDSLEDSPENRLALDEYALKFGQSLKRTMKITNMAKKFKEALAK